MRSDGICTLHWIVPTPVTLELANAVLAGFERVTRGIRVPLLFDGGDSKGVDRASRNRFEEATGPLAMAILVKSPFSRILANFFVGHNKKRAYPVQLFNTEADAVAWLRGFLR